MKGQIKKPDPDDAIVGFFTMDGASQGLLASRFDAREEMELTLRHARDPDPKISLAGLRHLRSILKDVATANGIVGSMSEVRETTDEDGSKVRQVVSTNKLINRIKEGRTRVQNHDPEKGHLEHHSPQEIRAEEPINDRSRRSLKNTNSSASNPVRLAGDSGSSDCEPDPSVGGVD
tara:strand:- start:456 stop:983 length:528 start_codon:yes stop_codon:yes gene_type:complete